jgi:probable HAF family extracellular repeat protein
VNPVRSSSLLLKESRLITTVLVLFASAASVAHAQRTPRARPAAQLPRYDVLLIQPGTTGTTSYTSARSVNDRGKVTGISSDGGFLWSAATGAVALGERQPGVGSSGYDVNLFGMVAGTSYEATLWTSVNALVPIPPPDGTVFPFAFGLNDTGRVVGEATVSSNLKAAWVWDPVNGTRDLRTLGVPGAASAMAINESNQIVGKRLASNYIAYRYDLNSGTFIDLGTFGGPTSEALGIDDFGRVVGSARNANYNTRPFLWTNGAGIRDLGSLGGQPYDFGEATSINVAGQVVGNSTTASGERHAFLWDASHGMRDLNALVDDLGAFRLITATRINNNGWIVGNGRNTETGGTRAYVLRPE